MIPTAPVTPSELRHAIAGAVSEVKAYELAAACEHLGLETQRDGEDPFRSKGMYVRARLQNLGLQELADLARRVVDEYGSQELRDVLGRLGVRGVDGELKNLIFAADSPKPKIVLPDSISNTIRIVENEQYCLVYDRPLEAHGLSWADLAAWWEDRDADLRGDPARARTELRHRLRRSLKGNGAEELVFDTYVNLGFDRPALIPQVYLHYDPYTVAELGGAIALPRQRMDFLLLMNQRARAVVEIDGIQHYADKDGRADTARYAAMMAEDRNLTLAGYEVYRIGGRELADRAGAKVILTDFFTRLLRRHGHLPS